MHSLKCLLPRQADVGLAIELDAAIAIRNQVASLTVDAALSPAVSPQSFDSGEYRPCALIRQMHRPHTNNASLTWLFCASPGLPMSDFVTNGRQSALSNLEFVTHPAEQI